MSAGWDESRVYSTSVLPPEVDESSNAETEKRFLAFIQEFRLGNVYTYRDQLLRNTRGKQYYLKVNLADLINFNEQLADDLAGNPTDLIPLFESAVKKSAKKILFTNPESEKEVPDFQIMIESDANLVPIRDLHAGTISKLVRIPGIIIATSMLSSRATHVHITCRTCRHVKVLPVQGGFSGISLPRVCDAPPIAGISKDCPMDPYVIVHDKSKFVDSQTLKLQEAPDMVPVGELPRHILLNADRFLTSKVTPGSRVNIMGIYSIYQNKSVKTPGAVAIRSPYVRVLGIQEEVEGGGRNNNRFSEEEEEEFIAMSRQPGLYDSFANSIAPSIFGSLDIKKAITCLLFGGSKKILPDGMRLRGDINVLLLGDPGTAKSQLLKFVHKLAPICVYTSGKGSSAAGLTASVQRDPQSREFYLEGGAMVLADGGVVCIDEFDKMRDEDRVAIHEAMEQQTISIAKAGITTILNSRTSVLAAANPIFGRYDDMKAPGDNIDFQTTILSRFDMIFIVKDEHNEQRDQTIAKHVMNIHMNRTTTENAVGEIDIDKMRRYISYCKNKCAPRLTEVAAEKLSSHFVSIRKAVHAVEQESNERSSIPITVRQLEAIIRISESIAKLKLAPRVSEADVDEAIRLFKHSTMDAVQNGQVEGMTRDELTQEVQKVESNIKRRLPVGWQASYVALAREFVQQQGYSQAALDRALWVMEKKDTIQFRNQRKTVHRVGV